MSTITLKAARVNKSLTQQAAAERLKISIDKLKNWESGRSFPNVIELKDIERLYGVSYNEINFLP